MMLEMEMEMGNGWCSAYYQMTEGCAKREGCSYVDLRKSKVEEGQRVQERVGRDTKLVL